ncbi:MAG: GTP cyclohydrolase II [Alphaproteobacteria bacterium]|jgi:GTP cyclohydrolase II|nr:GTP cyclohydrolase II [Alphaproteobacteria bacterium]MDP6624091.1 GTP cyclohydrolase II [Alphaproteobacteria bacterium]
MSGKGHIILTSHTQRGTTVPPAIAWGAATPADRGPVIATLTDPEQRNAIGTHAGSYSLYRALAVSSGHLDPAHVPDLTDTHPAVEIGPYPQWGDWGNGDGRIVSLDPYGHLIGEAFAEELAAGMDIRPTIAVTQAHLSIAEIREAITAGRLKPDGRVLSHGGEVRVTKAAIDPVWHLPGMARRFGIDETDLRRQLFEHTGGMYPELVTRSDLEVFVPPIGGQTAYIIGDPAHLPDAAYPVACRVHDECNGSDVFGSDICTCRPYLMHGIEACIEMAQQGGVGLIVYNRKEGRSLGEVTKFLVYNARKRQDGGDTAANYFERTECVAGVQDARFQELMPDVLHWLGVSRIDRFVSMSDLKHDAITGQRITIGERVEIPEELVPSDAAVEMAAKKAAGYYAEEGPPDAETLDGITGRTLE